MAEFMNSLPKAKFHWKTVMVESLTPVQKQGRKPYVIVGTDAGEFIFSHRHIVRQFAYLKKLTKGRYHIKYVDNNNVKFAYLIFTDDQYEKFCSIANKNRKLRKLCYAESNPFLT